MARALGRLSFGGRVPAVVGGLLLLTVLLSCAAAIGVHVGWPIGGLLALIPERVLAGEVHRLLTWTFIETSPLQLIFGLFMLWWLGRDLVGAWGSRRFALVWLGTTLLAAAATCVAGLFFGAVLGAPYVGGLAITEALIIAWGLSFPDRVVRVYFVLPVRGAVIAWGSVALTVAFAIYGGFASFVPALAASAAMLVYMHLPAKRLAPRAAPRTPPKPSRAVKRRASAAHLRVIEGGDRADAPVTPEMQATLDRLFGRGGPRNKPS